MTQPLECFTSVPGIPVVFEDDQIIVVDKPAGMLSQPGRTEPDSVVGRVRDACVDATGPMLVHRLDMDTSGLLILAKNRLAHRQLQQQFEHRQIGKRYRARLSAAPTVHAGTILLPLRLDINNRPRQIVCHEHGKPSKTLWRKSQTGSPRAIVLFPVTSRTHQLRVHLADPQGLGIAIEGDRLYGNVQHHDDGDRMMLHAEVLAFDHPQSGVRHTLTSPAPFI